MPVNELMEILSRYNENDYVEIVGDSEGAELQIGTYRQNIVNNKNYPLFILKDTIRFWNNQKDLNNQVFYFFSNFFQKTIDKHAPGCYNVVTGWGKPHPGRGGGGLFFCGGEVGECGGGWAGGYRIVTNYSKRKTKNFLKNAWQVRHFVIEYRQKEREGSKNNENLLWHGRNNRWSVCGQWLAW